MAEVEKTVAEKDSDAKGNDDKVMQRIDQFHKFYSDALTKILTIIGLAFLVVGVIIPLWIQNQQSKSFEGEASNIRMQLENQLQLQSTELENLRKAVAKQVKTDSDLAKESVRGLALLMQMQGSTHHTIKQYFMSSYFYVTASLNYAHIGDTARVRLLLNGAAEKCLPKVRAEDISKSEVRKTVPGKIFGLLSQIENLPAGGECKSEIEAVRTELYAAMKRN